MTDLPTRFKSAPRPSPAVAPDTLDDKVSRIDRTLVDVRGELEEVAQMQKRGNVVLLRVQGDIRRLEKTVAAGFQEMREQHAAVLKVLGARGK